ncbi:MAG: flavodoxin family protein [Candidatus Lokiarchaeota archaeon]|nr:flavodoxin family protein [Candidatus Lokiarchaeota archaeon]
MKEFYVLGINGSHRIEPRNTHYLLERVMQPLKKKEYIKTEIISLGDKELKYCTSCFSCNKGPCPIKDDMTEIYRKMLTADAIIIGSPVYIFNVSAKIKTLFDRCRAILFREENYNGILKGKIGASVVVGFVRNGGAELTTQAIRNFFDIHQMFYAGYVMGFSGQQGGVTKDITGKAFAKTIGKKVLELLELLKDVKVSRDTEFVEQIHKKVD